MRKKKGFELRNVGGEYMVIAERYENIDFCNLIGMNESAAYVWRSIGDDDFTADDVAEMLCGEYDVEAPTAIKDAKTLIRQCLDAGIIE